jgi:hypothetical protein
MINITIKVKMAMNNDSCFDVLAIGYPKGFYDTYSSHKSIVSIVSIE